MYIKSNNYYLINMITLRNKFKDAVPFDTISFIRKSLYNLGIEVYEKKWDNISSECFSVRLEVEGFLNVGTNGKGTTRIFALASAYGELMERLQNKKLFNKTYGLKYNHEPFPDERTDDIIIFSEKYPEIMEQLVQNYKNMKFFELLKKYHKLSFFSTFYDVFEEKEQRLPSVLINMACGTNGMCAGNSPHEALCHGICEIMERYVSKQILLHQLALPEISIEDINDKKLIDIIVLLKNAGLDVIIKDCTLGGIYPVVGVLVINKYRTRYQFRLGSESIFSIALERCLTEILQGHDLQLFTRDYLLSIEYHFNISAKNINENLMKISKNGSGQFPTSIFCNVGASNIYKNAFLPKIESNKQNYMYLLKKLKQNNFKLYIRNLSFLNFPTYKIYIPGMSEVFINNVSKIEERIKINYTANYMLNIFSCSNEELEFLLVELESYCNNNSNNCYFENSPYFKSTNLHLMKANGFAKLDLRLIVSLLAYILGKDKIAANYFALYMKTSQGLNSSILNYYHCITAFLHLKAESMDDNEIRLKLFQLFSENTVSEVLDDFKERSLKLFSKMPLPTCPDCKNCNISKSCLFEEWEKKNIILNEKLKNFNNFHIVPLC